MLGIYIYHIGASYGSIINDGSPSLAICHSPLTSSVERDHHKACAEHMLCRGWTIFSTAVALTQHRQIVGLQLVNICLLKSPKGYSDTRDRCTTEYTYAKYIYK